MVDGNWEAGCCSDWLVWEPKTGKIQRRDKTENQVLRRQRQAMERPLCWKESPRDIVENSNKAHVVTCLFSVTVEHAYKPTSDHQII